MIPSRLRAWINKYGNAGVCLVAIYLAVRYLTRHRLVLLVGSGSLSGLIGLAFVCRLQPATPRAANVISSPPPVLSEPKVVRKVSAEEWSEAYDELFEAIQQEDVEKAKGLLHEGVNPDAIGTTDTPLTAAISTNNLALVTLLLDSGADPNWTGDIQHLPRPLTLAAGDGNFEMVKLLVARGAEAAYRDEKAERSSANGNDDSALYYARKELGFHPDDEELQHIVTFLKAHGAK